MRPARPRRWSAEARDTRTVSSRVTPTSAIMGAGLGATTGWIHRLALKHQNVKQFANCKYDRYDAEKRTLYVTIGGKPVVMEDVELVMCHGQRAHNDLAESLAALVPGGSSAVHLIGGCKDPSELDAKRAVRQGYELALKL